jgi:hypothetical protein
MASIGWSGRRDLNSRPLDSQIGPSRSLSVNDISLRSVVDRGHALSLVGLVCSRPYSAPLPCGRAYLVGAPRRVLTAHRGAQPLDRTSQRSGAMSIDLSGGTRQLSTSNRWMESFLICLHSRRNITHRRCIRIGRTGGGEPRNGAALRRPLVWFDPLGAVELKGVAKPLPLYEAYRRT